MPTTEPTITPVATGVGDTTGLGVAFGVGEGIGEGVGVVVGVGWVAPLWVTVNVCPAMVMVPVRWLVPVLLATE